MSIRNRCSLRGKKKRVAIQDSMGPISTFVGLGIGVSCLLSEVLLGDRFYENSRPYLQESKIYEPLNNIMKDAINHYNKKEYSDFLYSLSICYAKPKLLVGIKEVRASNNLKISLDIRPAVIVRELLDRDFSPEGVAYFLVLLGEVLLTGPQLKPKHQLCDNVFVELPKYSEFNYFAKTVFEEVWKNVQLTERAKEIDTKIQPKIFITQANCIENLTRTPLNNVFSVSNDCMKERLVVSVTVRLEELKNIAKMNHVIAQIIAGGIDNLKQSAETFKSVKENLMRGLTEENMFAVTEVGSQALSDLLAAFGYPDNIPSDRNELISRNQTFRELEDKVLIKKINKILTGDQTVSHCESVILFDDDETDEFVLLNKVLGRILKLDKTKFVQSVCKNYNDNVRPLTFWIKDIMRKENFRDVTEWQTSFLKRKHPLTFQYLPFLSKMYNLIFTSCTVKYHPDHQYIFSPTKEVINRSRGSAKASIYVLTEENNDSSYTRLIKGVFVACEVSLNYIFIQLDNVNDRKRKVDLLNQIALYYRRQAEKLDTTHHLEALPKWSCAQKFYVDSLKLNRNHLIAMLGYAKCLIMLNKYKLAMKFLIERANQKTYFRDSAERWFLLGVVRRKLQNYDEAESAIKEAFKLKKNYIEAKNELNLILKLKGETIAHRIQLYKQMSRAHVEPNREQYNILSVDGGGIRGLMPAIWLSELERKTQLNSCSMFHMMAGTSTGAIVTAALSLPDKQDTRLPRYRAVDIVKFYTDHSSQVFSRRLSMMKLFKGSTYTNEGRQTLFNKYFENTRLSHMLTDLVITAAHSGSSTTDLFQRSVAREDLSKNHKITDVLMCTTAAPTYFPPYKLDNSIFVDGGVQANNPAMIAYAEACRSNVNRDNIFILSLGTGDYVPDPLHPNANRNVLFWYKNLDSLLKVIFDGPQNNIDCQLGNMLGSEKYHRWQIWLEEPIMLDDIRKETIDNMMELARAYFEEMENSDSDNRLGKLIERLKGPGN